MSHDGPDTDHRPQWPDTTDALAAGTRITVELPRAEHATRIIRTGLGRGEADPADPWVGQMRYLPDPVDTVVLPLWRNGDQWSCWLISMHHPKFVYGAAISHTDLCAGKTSVEVKLPSILAVNVWMALVVARCRAEDTFLTAGLVANTLALHVTAPVCFVDVPDHPTGAPVRDILAELRSAGLLNRPPDGRACYQPRFPHPDEPTSPPPPRPPVIVPGAGRVCSSCGHQRSIDELYEELFHFWTRP